MSKSELKRLQAMGKSCPVCGTPGHIEGVGTKYFVADQQQDKDKIERLEKGLKAAEDLLETILDGREYSVELSRYVKMKQTLAQEADTSAR